MMHHSFSAGVRLAFPLLAAGDGYSSQRKKKADVVECPALDHVGLLFNEPPRSSGVAL